MKQLVTLGALLAVSCGGGSAGPTQPSSPVSVMGTWAGSLSDETGAGRSTFTLTQTGSSVSGSFGASQFDSRTGNNIDFAGTISGSSQGSTLALTLSVPLGNYPIPYSVCTTTSNASIQATATSLSGTYTGSSSGAAGCARTWMRGQLSLTRQ